MHQLSKPQKLIYDMEQYAKGSIAVICGSLLIKGNKEISELKKAINELYRLNDALRIQITETDGAPMQSVRRFTECEIDVLHFKNRKELTEYGQAYAKEPLDLYGPLCEIKIILQKEQYGILVKLHHIIGDAWTMALICTQFQTVLNGNPTEAYSYLAFLEKEQEYRQSKRYEKDRAFFLEQFKTCDEITYLSEKKTNTLESSRMSFVLNAETAKHILDYAKKKHVCVYRIYAGGSSLHQPHQNEWGEILHRHSDFEPYGGEGEANNGDVCEYGAASYRFESEGVFCKEPFCGSKKSVFCVPASEIQLRRHSFRSPKGVRLYRKTV